MNNQILDVIIRFHDARRLAELERALLSLAHQDYAPIHPIVVCQRLAAEELDAVRRMVGKFDWACEHREPTVLNIQEPAVGDIRTRLLNAGIAAGEGRYLAVLDYDDYLYAHAYQFLVGKLLDGQSAIAFGGILVKHVHAAGDLVYNLRRGQGPRPGNTFAELMHTNFCPIHSFVVDREKIAARDLYFDEVLTRLEDYDFFLRICASYPADFSGRETVVGVYNWKIDGSQTVRVFGGDPSNAEANAREWEVARAHIETLKSDIRARPGAGNPR